MERTRKLLTDTHTHTHTQRKDENIIPPWHTSYAGGKIRAQGPVVQSIVSLMSLLRGLLIKCFITL